MESSHSFLEKFLTLANGILDAKGSGSGIILGEIFQALHHGSRYGGTAKLGETLDLSSGEDRQNAGNEGLMHPQFYVILFYLYFFFHYH